MTDEQFDSISSKLSELEEEVIGIKISLKDIKSDEFLHRVNELRNSFELDQEKYLEIHQTSLENAKRLNGMLNELKGIISMTRAALKDRKVCDSIQSIKSILKSLESCQENISPLP